MLKTCRSVNGNISLITAAMVRMPTGASRIAMQRNLVGMETRALILAVTGQGQYRI